MEKPRVEIFCVNGGKNRGIWNFKDKVRRLRFNMVMPKINGASEFYGEFDLLILSRLDAYA
ncbi:hypothetical protein IC582_013990 [Cucumis melo]